MTHSLVLVIVPSSIYLKGMVCVRDYIKRQMKPYYEERQVIPYIYMTAQEFRKDYEDFKQTTTAEVLAKYPTIDLYRTQYCEYDLIDYDGNILSNTNKDSFWDGYGLEGERDLIATSDLGYPIRVHDFLDQCATIPDDHLYHSILDQNGVYHCDRTYGWRGDSEPTTAADEWRTRFEKIVRHANPNDLIIHLDCHV